MMKLQLRAAGLAAVLIAGPAVAQGTFSPGNKPYHAPEPHHYVLPGAPEPAKPHAAMPDPKPFKPYQPPASQSVYSAPKSAPKGAKDCELSVYVDACRW